LFATTFDKESSIAVKDGREPGQANAGRGGGDVTDPGSSHLLPRCESTT
jgi:hypothetical protein